MIETSWIFLESLQQWVIPEKIHAPRWMGLFFNPPLSPGFPEAQEPPPHPPSCLDFQDKRPPSRLGFQEKLLGLNLMYF